MKDESDESGAVFQSVLDGLGEIIVFALDRDYRYTAFNENHRREMKAVWNTEIKLGTNLLDCMADPGLRAKAKASLDRALAGESFVEVQHQPGVDVYYELQWRPQRSPAGDTMGVIALIRDITGHQRAENALTESEANFRAVFEGASIGMSLTAPDGRLKHINKAFAAMLGYSVEEIQNLSFAAITHPDDIAESRECIRSLLARERVSYRMEKRYRHRDGRYIWTDVSTTLHRNASGEPLHFITNIMDISARKQAEQALRASEMQLQVVLESTADGILAVDGQGKVIKANQRFAELWRIPPSLMNPGEDRALLEFVLNQLSDPDAFLSKVQSLYGTDVVAMDTLAFKDGRVFERYSFPMLLDGTAIGRVWSFRDITLRRRTEEALARRAEELAQFNAAAVGRELRMVELKEEVNLLAHQLGRSRPYAMEMLNQAAQRVPLESKDKSPENREPEMKP